MCFENEKKGLGKLKKMRRRPGMTRVPHKNMLNRAEVLLSNSAGRSNIPLPPTVMQLPNSRAEDYARLEKACGDLEQWWKKNKKQITLYDPWLETLKKQKVD